MNDAERMGRTAEVLLVDDDANDTFLVRLAFERAQCSVRTNVHAVGNGRECLAFLRHEGSHAAAPVPDLVLLDLNMPLMDGRQTLVALHADPALRRVPVIVLTTSASDEDIRQMYALGCRTYIVKPLELDDFQNAIDLICRYWLELAALPSESR